MKRVIVELTGAAEFSLEVAKETDVAKLPGFNMDLGYDPVPVSPAADKAPEFAKLKVQPFLVRGEIDEDKIEKLRKISVDTSGFNQGKR